MAITKILGVVRGFSDGDDGQIHLSVEDATHSDEVKYTVREMSERFDPKDPRHGFNAKNIPCPIRPGFASYHATLNPLEAKGIEHGSRVVLEVEFYNVRKVVFSRNRWAAIPEVKSRVISVRAEHEARQDPKPDKPQGK